MPTLKILTGYIKSWKSELNKQSKKLGAPPQEFPKWLRFPFPYLALFSQDDVNKLANNFHKYNKHSFHQLVIGYIYAQRCEFVYHQLL